MIVIKYYKEIPIEDYIIIVKYYIVHFCNQEKAITIYRMNGDFK